MRGRFAIYLVFAVLLVSGQLVQPAMAATAAHVGEACETLGTTTLDKDHSSVIACVLSAPNEEASTCAEGGGCVWKSMHGGGNCQSKIDACKSGANAYGNCISSYAVGGDKLHKSTNILSSVTVIHAADGRCRVIGPGHAFQGGWGAGSRTLSDLPSILGIVDTALMNVCNEWSCYGHASCNIFSDELFCTLPTITTNTEKPYEAPSAGS